MREAERIADQLQRSIKGEAWHGPSLMEILAGVTAEQVSVRLMNTHTIWEILLHVRAWNTAVLRRIRGEVVELSEAEDFPPVSESTEQAWEDDVRSVKLAQSKIYNAVMSMTDTRLQETVPGKPYNFYYMLHGLAQHNLYHAGQIALIKKLS